MSNKRVLALAGCGGLTANLMQALEESGQYEVRPLDVSEHDLDNRFLQQIPPCRAELTDRQARRLAKKTKKRKSKLKGRT